MDAAKRRPAACDVNHGRAVYVCGGVLPECSSHPPKRMPRSIFTTLMWITRSSDCRRKLHGAARQRLGGAVCALTSQAAQFQTLVQLQGGHPTMGNKVQILC